MACDAPGVHPEAIAFEISSCQIPEGSSPTFMDRRFPNTAFAGQIGFHGRMSTFLPGRRPASHEGRGIMQGVFRGIYRSCATDPHNMLISP